MSCAFWAAGPLSGDGRGFARRRWRRHPVLSALQLTLAVGLAVLGLVDLAGGHSRWRGGLSVVLWMPAFVVLVLLVRRDEPPVDL